MDEMRTKIHPARFHSYCINLLLEIHNEKQELIDKEVKRLRNRKLLWIIPFGMSRQKAVNRIKENTRNEYHKINSHRWRVVEICTKIITMVVDGYEDIEVELTDEEMKLIGIEREK